MIRLGVPNNIDKYIALDEKDAFKAHQGGAIPEWRDEDVLYFKKTSKIIKILKKLGIIEEQGGE